MTIVCNVDGLEAEYKITAQDDGSKKCSIVFRSSKKKLNVEKVFAGEDAISMLIKSGGGKPVWHFDPYLTKNTPAHYTTGESGGETMEVTLGEMAASKLFPCSGFVRGDLVGLIRAPAVHVKMMGKDIWAFLLFFENALAGDNALEFGKNSLSVIHELSSATAELRADNADRRKVIVTLTSTGKDFKKLKVNLTRITSTGYELEEQLGEFGKDDVGPRELSWTPVNRSGAELLWVFQTSIVARHGPLKDAIELLGAKVNRSVFADGFGGRQMDDFILADGGKMKYRIELVMERHFGSHVNDSTTMKL